MKTLLFLLTLLLGSLNPHTCKADTREAVKTLPENYSTSYMDSTLINNSFDATWQESDGPHKIKCFFWNKNTGAQEIKIDKDLIELGFEPIDMSPYVTCFNVAPTFLDDLGNVFLRIRHKSFENLPNHGPGGSKTNEKLGVWNKKFGFKLLEIDGIQNITKLQIFPKGIFISGLALDKEKAAIIELPQDLWGKQTELDTPWDNLDLGDLGARLYSMGELYRYPKCWLNVDNTIISLMIEMEAASVLDILQYKTKKAVFEIEKSQAEGWYNEDAHKQYDDAIKYIENLKKYLQGLDISHERVFLLDLPSNQWAPTNK